MSSIGIYVDLLESDKEIANKILQAIADYVNSTIPPLLQNIKKRLIPQTIALFQNTETYNSLLYGELAGHFGLPRGNRKNNIDTILTTIANNIEITFVPIKVRATQFANGLIFKVLLSDFSDILSLSQAVIFTESGDALEWLKWLLTMGDSIIIREYEIDFFPGEGRSGSAIMIPEQGGVWRVPPEYAGTYRNNWLTKALLQNADTYLEMVGQVIQNEIQGI